MKQKLFSMLALLLMAATGAWAQSVPTLAEATTADYGKVVCAAGHLHDAKTAVPDGCTAVGILGKVTETGHGLILALQDATAQKWNTINGWTSVDTYAGTTLKVLPDDAARGSLTSYTTLGETAVSNWAVAQKSDYEAIFSNLGSTAGDSDGTTYDGNMNAYIITGVGGTAITGTYWSATERDDLGAWYFSSDYWINDLKTLSVSVRPVLGFGGEAAPAAATGYSVTLKDGTEDADKWTISPKSEGLSENDQVTITYTGEKRVKSVTAVKKPAVTYPLLSAATTDDIGKVVCAAGHLHDAKTAVPDGCTAVGIVGKVTENGQGLILALQDATNQAWNTINGWTSVTTYAGTTLKVLPDGARGANLTSYTVLGSTAVSNWAVAQKSDYEAIFINLGSTAGDSDGKVYNGNVNAYITTDVGGTAMSGEYWSATDKGGVPAWFYDNRYWNSGQKTYTKRVRPVLGFGGKAEEQGSAAAVPEGAINGKFTVSASGDQVYFSKGNLKYNGSAWSFFDNQYDYLTTHDGTNWDKFGWSTSTTTYGMSTSTASNNYSGNFVDWGATMGTGWRTLTKDEWTYLFNTRTSGSTVFGTENARYAHATINTDGTGVNGMILFPDGVTIANTEVTTAGTVNGNSAWGTKCTSAQWSALESAGCVFLPAAGNRDDSSVESAGSGGRYWSGTANSAIKAYRVLFSSGNLDPASINNRYFAYSVRLVRPAE